MISVKLYTIICYWSTELTEHEYKVWGDVWWYIGVIGHSHNILWHKNGTKPCHCKHIPYLWVYLEKFKNNLNHLESIQVFKEIAPE